MSKNHKTKSPIVSQRDSLDSGEALRRVDEKYREGRIEYSKALEKAWDHYLKLVDLMISSAMASALLFLASIKFIEWKLLPGQGFIAPSIASGLLAFTLFVMWRFASQHYLELQLLYPQYTEFQFRAASRPVNAPRVSIFDYGQHVQKVALGPRLHDGRVWKWALRPLVWFSWRMAPFLGFALLLSAWGLALLALFSASPTWLRFP